jgi:hypothetical protein
MRCPLCGLDHDEPRSAFELGGRCGLPDPKGAHLAQRVVADRGNVGEMLQTSLASTLKSPPSTLSETWSKP